MVDTTVVKEIKIYDDLEADSDNLIKIFENSYSQIGTGSRIWESVKLLKRSTDLIK
jgi:hypothetical protein